MRYGGCHVARVAGLVLIALAGGSAWADDAAVVLHRIAFGSCAQQDRPQPIWEAILESKPDLFLYIGDNIYGDTDDMAELQAKWDVLGRQPGYERLRKNVPIYAVWDDHDYGKNDAGAEYPKKRQSQRIFLDFFDEPLESPRRSREGLYGSRMFGPENQRVQVILLDTRYFRSPLKKTADKAEPGEGIRGPYLPNLDADATLLGEVQWRWLEERLKEPARLRIIASSIQVIANEHRWEKWGNFPRERRRLLDLLHKTRANGVILVSGDRHQAEISRLTGAVDYPLYDVTASSLNQPGKWHNEINPHRVGLVWFAENSGLIDIDWTAADPVIRLQVRDVDGNVVLQTRTRLSELQPGAEGE